jgi:hypothetical protein
MSMLPPRPSAQRKATKRAQIGADALQGQPQRHAGPSTGVVPSLHKEVADDNLALRQLGGLRHLPALLLRDAAGELRLPTRGIHRLHVFHRFGNLASKRAFRRDSFTKQRSILATRIGARPDAPWYWTFRPFNSPSC